MTYCFGHVYIQPIQSLRFEISLTSGITPPPPPPHIYFQGLSYLASNDDLCYNRFTCLFVDFRLPYSRKLTH